MYAAYFDRTTDNDKAILLIHQLQKEFHVPLASLPSGSEPGQWFLVSVEQDEITAIQFDQEKTIKMQSDIQNRLNRLQSTSKSKFKRRK